MPGFASLTPSGRPQAPQFGSTTPATRGMYGAPGTVPVPGAGMGPVGTAAREARYAMDTLGVPSFNDIWSKISGFAGGGPFSSREFGNAGMAGAAAADARGQMTSAQKRFNIDRGGFLNPTGTSAYKAEMGLARERTAAASEEAARQSAEAQSRRGYVGGYDPRQSDIDRMRALSEAGFGAVKDIRDQQLGQEQVDVADLGGARSAWADLTKTQAELPTKWLSAISPILSSALGAFGGGSSYFHDALMADQSQRDFNQAQKDKFNQPLGPGTVGTRYHYA